MFPLPHTFETEYAAIWLECLSSPNSQGANCPFMLPGPTEPSAGPLSSSSPSLCVGEITCPSPRLPKHISKPPWQCMLVYILVISKLVSEAQLWVSRHGNTSYSCVTIPGPRRTSAAFSMQYMNVELYWNSKLWYHRAIWNMKTKSPYSPARVSKAGSFLLKVHFMVDYT